MTGGMTTRFWIGNIPFTLLDIAASITSLWILTTLFRPSVRAYYPRFYLIAWAVWWAWAGITLLIALPHITQDTAIYAFMYLMRGVIYTLAPLIICTIRHNLARKVLTSTITFIALLGLVQFFLYPYLAHLRYLGWDDHLLRLFGVLLDPNFMGIWFSMTVPFLIAQLNGTRKKQSILISLLVLCVVVLSVILSFSRAAYLTLLTGVIISTMYATHLRRYIIVGCLAVITITSVYLSGQSYLEGRNIFRLQSTMQRIESWDTALTILNSSPLFGTGFNTYRFEQFQLGKLSEHDWKTTHAGNAPDSSYLLAAATTGIIGVIIFLSVWITLLLQGHRSPSPQSWVSVSTSAGFLVSGIVINSLFYPPLFLLWGIIYLSGLKGDAA